MLEKIDLGKLDFKVRRKRDDGIYIVFEFHSDSEPLYIKLCDYIYELAYMADQVNQAILFASYSNYCLYNDMVNAYNPYLFSTLFDVGVFPVDEYDTHLHVERVSILRYENGMEWEISFDGKTAHELSVERETRKQVIEFYKEYHG